MILFKKIFLIIVISVISVYNAFAESVVLRGNAKDYAGLNVEIECYTDYITHNRQTLSVLRIDDAGHFECSLNIDEITYAFLDLGKYRAYIYLEPAHTYDIVLPPYSPRSDADRFNLFFEPENIVLGIANDDEILNKAIANFDFFFDEIYNKNIIKLVRQNNKQLADSIISRIDSVAQSQNCDKEYFSRFVQYRKAQIYATPRMNITRSVMKALFVPNNVEYNIPSYWDAIDLVGRNFLSSFKRTKIGKQMSDNVNTFDEIFKAVSRDSLFSPNVNLCEALILKGIYDDYYSGLISEGKTDTLFITATNQMKNDKNIHLAFNMLVRKNHLKSGSMAPEFTLLDMQGKEVSLKDFKGKFVYLAFLHTDNFACAKDMPAMTGLAKKYHRDMTVVGILTDEQADKLPNYINKRKYPWIALSYNMMQSVILDYEIKTLPSYFIIDPEGRIALPSAPTPTEHNIVTAIAGQIKKYKNELLKRNPQKPRDIYDVVNYSY